MTPASSTPKGSTGGALPNPLAEALYEQGMTHYQRREWKETLEYFSQLKEVEPHWTGLESLIDEASWFLQLESVESHPDQAPAQESKAPGRGRSFFRWLLPLGVGLALVALLFWWQGWIPGIGNRLEREVLFNRGQASLAAGDYQTASEAFTQLEQLKPGDPAGTRRPGTSCTPGATGAQLSGGGGCCGCRRLGSRRVETPGRTCRRCHL